MNGRSTRRPINLRFPLLAGLPIVLLTGTLSGCLSLGFPYAPLHSEGIPAGELPDSFRAPVKPFESELNLASLTAPPGHRYLLGPGDVLEVTIPNLYEEGRIEVFQVQVDDNGDVYLPLVTEVAVGDLTLAGARKAINAAYADGFLPNPQVMVKLVQKGTVEAAVLGQVNAPGVVTLPRDIADVAHALAAAEGLTEVAADMVEIHRRLDLANLPAGLPPAPGDGGAEKPEDSSADKPMPGELDLPDGWRLEPGGPGEDAKIVIKIPLRGHRDTVFDGEGVAVRATPSKADVRLQPGDVVRVPRETADPFYVVGPLSRVNVVNFSVRDRDRELGNAFLLPDDREIDAVTAVAMAGFIDPIESPTTVTIQRNVLGGDPLLINVDLFKARESWRENVIIEPGDIIYLNPDLAWYARIVFNQIVGDLITIPYAAEATRGIIGGRN